MASGQLTITTIGVLLLVLPMIITGTILEGQADQPDAVFLTSQHRAGLELFQDHWTGNNTTYKSSFRPYQEFDLWIIGAERNYTIEIVDIETIKGNTTDLVTRLSFNLTNMTELELIVSIDDLVYNFGRMTVSKIPLVLAEDLPGPPTILRSEMASLLFRNRVVISISSVITIATGFIFVVIVKRGRVTAL